MRYYIESTSLNPYVNLSVEEYLLKNIEKDDFVLFLWQNENTVVVGRNQNVLAEVNRKKLFDSNGYLARRISGGGAVYHDLGNLNFTFICGEREYSVSSQLDFIMDILKNYGIKGEFKGRNDLLVRGKKFSGSAYYKKGNRNLHHGTILVDVDLSKLLMYLNVDPEKLRSKAISSVQSRVVNLKDINGDINIESLKRKIREQYFSISDETKTLSFDRISSMKEVKILESKNQSQDWLYGESPVFDISFKRRFDWGNVEINFQIENNWVEKCKIFSDSLSPDLIEEIEYTFQNIDFTKSSLLAGLEGIGESDIIRDIRNLIKSKDIII